jgi:hypothetical protein
MPQVSPPAAPPQLARGTVVGMIARRYRVRNHGLETSLIAEPAVSCLVEPNVGDSVLLALHDDGAHILAVLSRAGGADAGAATSIAVPGDLEISSDTGRVTLRAPKGLRSVTAGDAELCADTVRVSAREGTMAVSALRYLGKQLHAHVSQIHSVAESVESVASRVVQRADRVYRFIAEAEQVRAHYLEWAAELAINIKSKTTIMRSAELTKIDGQQIHLG